MKALQHLVYGAGSYHASDLAEANYAEAAKALGGNGIRVEELGQLTEALKPAMSLAGPSWLPATRQDATGVDNRVTKLKKGDRGA